MFISFQAFTYILCRVISFGMSIIAKQNMLKKAQCFILFKVSSYKSQDVFKKQKTNTLQDTQYEAENTAVFHFMPNLCLFPC